MAWTATLIEAKEGDGYVWCRVIYSDGTQKIDRTYRLASIDDATVEGIARNEIAGFDAVAASVGKLTYQSGDVVDTAPLLVAVALPPSAADTAQSAWLSDLSLYRQLKALADAGVTSQTLEPIANVQARLQKNWLDSYLGMV